MNGYVKKILVAAPVFVLLYIACGQLEKRSALFSKIAGGS